MHEHRLLEVAVVELLGAVCHDNDRKFQSFGLVDGQNADRTAGGLGTDRLEILALLEHAAQQAHKVKQAAEALSLKRARPLENVSRLLWRWAPFGSAPYRPSAPVWS